MRSLAYIPATTSRVCDTLSAVTSKVGGTANGILSGFIISLRQAVSCTHAGYTSAGAIASPNGSSGSYLGKTGAFAGHAPPLGELTA